MAGAGKSTVARGVARRIGRARVDLDDEIVARRGTSVAEIFATLGEDGFRRLETEALREVLERPPAVIATGGGVVLAETNRALLAESATTVWLRAEESVLVERLRRSPVRRPLLTGDVATEVARLVAERDVLYRQCADQVVDVSDLSIDEVVSCVVEALR